MDLSFFQRHKWTKYVLAVIALFLIYQGYKYYQKKQDEKLAVEQKEKSEKIFKPVIQTLDDQIKINKASDSAYDIDKTIRVIHEIDEAILKHDNLEDYLMKISKEDYRNVAPEILEARKKLLQTTMEIYSRQTRLKDQPDYWDLIREYTLAAGSGINPEGLTNPIPLDGIKYDPEMTKKTYQQYLESKKVSEEIKQEVRELKTKLLSQLYEYSTVYYKYYDEWDRICLHRDKAYLAAKSGQWDVVASEADNAMKRAPHDREAHILRGLAMVAAMPAASASIKIVEAPNQPDPATTFLNEFIQKNPDYSAPAMLLKGVAMQKKGDLQAAKLLFEESAAQYPKQADKLQSNFDPYKMRAYLRKSKEGNQITEMYKTTMLGGGYFTPDLQLAKMYYGSGNAEAGKNKVLDHFARRRNQSQWDYIISDIQFCETAFGKDFNQILPENHFLQLKVKQTLIGNKLNLSIVNHSQKRLKNASLILCIQFTDMMREDYIAIKADKTLPAIISGEENDFGAQEISYQLFGKEKGVDDIALVRAIIISDEAVNWVDTDDFKFEKMKSEKEKIMKLSKSDVANSAKELGFDQAMIVKLIKENAKISISSSKIKLNDQVSIDMPRQLAFLNPIFRLTGDGNIMIEPTENSLDDKGIKLNFKLNKITNSDIKLYTTKMYTKFGEFEVIWSRDPKSGALKLQDVKMI